MTTATKSISRSICLMKRPSRRAQSSPPMVDGDEGTVTIVEADYEFDLSDVPQEFLDVFINSGVCLDALEEHLITEDIVYGD